MHASVIVDDVAKRPVQDVVAGCGARKLRLELALVSGEVDERPSVVQHGGEATDAAKFAAEDALRLERVWNFRMVGGHACSRTLLAARIGAEM